MGKKFPVLMAFILAGIGWSTWQVFSQTQIGEKQIKDSAITFNKVAENAVSDTKIVDDTIKNADIYSAANIVATKLVTGIISNTEFNFLDGASSNIQNQIDGSATDTNLSDHASTTTGVHGLTISSPSDAQMLIYGSSAWRNRTLSGDVTVDSTAVATVANDSHTHIATNIADGSVNDTEFQYINSLTSNVQTQMDLKSPLASPTFTGTVTIPTPFTLGAVSVLPTGTELNFVDNVTSAIQTQLDGKVGSDSSVYISTVERVKDLETTDTPVFAGLTITNRLDASKVEPGIVSNTEFGYLDGVTSAIQTQFNGKEPSVSTGADTNVWHGNKTFSPIVEYDLALTDTTIGNVSTAKHGFVPKATGAGNTFLRDDGTYATPAGAGDVVGPASSTDNYVAIFSGATGKLLKQSTLFDTGTTGNFNVAGTLKIGGLTAATLSDTAPNNYFLQQTGTDSAITMPNTTTTTYTDVNATNCAVTFTAPRTGKYKVTFNGSYEADSLSTTAMQVVTLFVLTDNTNTNTSNSQGVGGAIPAPITGISRVYTPISIQGIFSCTAATSYTIKLKYKHFSSVGLAQAYLNNIAYGGGSFEFFVEELTNSY